MKKLLVLCLISLLFAQKSEWQKDFNEKSLFFFTTNYFAENRNDLIPFNQNDLEYFLNTLMEKKDAYNEVDINTAHLLFRYFLLLDQEENAYKAGYLSLELSREQTENQFYQYIAAFYQYYAGNFSIWTHIRHAFDGIKAEKKESRKTIIKGLDDSHPYKLLSLCDILFLHNADFRNYRLEIELCRTILSKNYNEKSLLKYIAEKSYELGDFETAISAYSTLNNLSSSNAEQNINYLEISKSYYYLGLFSISKQYLINLNLVTDSLQKLNSIALLLKNDLKLSEPVYNEEDSIIQYLDRKYHITAGEGLAENVVEQLSGIENEDHSLDFYLNRENLLAAERTLNKKLETDSNESIRLYYMAKFYWKKRDYFNSKRNLHNLIHDNSLEENPKLKSYANLILADILVNANEKDKAEEYIDEVNPEYLMFYDRVIYQTVNFAIKD